MDSKGITSLILTVLLQKSTSKLYGLQSASGPYLSANGQGNVPYSMNTHV